MSLDKAIFYKKEKRKPYRDSRRFDYSCRNHGGCPYCESNRTYKNKEKDRLAREQIKCIQYI
jgi:hypothetical protein